MTSPAWFEVMKKGVSYALGIESGYYVLRLAKGNVRIAFLLISSIFRTKVSFCRS